VKRRQPIAVRIFAAVVALVGGLGLACASPASAQEPSDAGIGGLIRGVVLDPTTYAPAVIAYDATMRDWDSSQVFFEHGYRERNARFTLSGRPNDLPVSYEVGQRRILGDSLVMLQASALNNVSSRIVERVLMKRYPHHRRLVKAAGWVERITFASVLSYRLSVQHYRQANHNTTLARQLGYR
jgi:hypothetical protein